MDMVVQGPCRVRCLGRTHNHNPRTRLAEIFFWPLIQWPIFRKQWPWIKESLSTPRKYWFISLQWPEQYIILASENASNHLWSRKSLIFWNCNFITVAQLATQGHTTIQRENFRSPARWLCGSPLHAREKGSLSSKHMTFCSCKEGDTRENIRHQLVEANLQIFASCQVDTKIVQHKWKFWRNIYSRSSTLVKATYSEHNYTAK